MATKLNKKNPIIKDLFQKNLNPRQLNQKKVKEVLKEKKNKTK